MKKLKKEDIKKEVFDLYDAFAHNKMQRREFIEKLSLYAVGGITVASLMSFLMPNFTDTLLCRAMTMNWIPAISITNQTI